MKYVVVSTNYTFKAAVTHAYNICLNHEHSLITNECLPSAFRGKEILLITNFNYSRQMPHECHVHCKLVI